MNKSRNKQINVGKCLEIRVLILKFATSYRDIMFLKAEIDIITTF